MKIYTLHTKQNLPISVDEAWEFLSSPRNLKTITPDYMGFHILSGAEKPMFPGQIIQYIVTPVLGIPTKWVTEITHLRDFSVNCLLNLPYELRVLGKVFFRLCVAFPK